MSAHRIAWFSPLPPDASGIAAYSAELLTLLDGDVEIDRFNQAAAHDFVWRHRRRAYDLNVYQLGNAPWHDFMWAYAANFPGLIVLHDARLHHARARALLRAGRLDDYRREFRYDEPGAPPAAAEYAVEGLGGPIYYLWRFVGALVRTARGVAVHNARVAADLRQEFPSTPIETVRMGVPEITAPAEAGRATRADLHIPADAIVFAAFGKITEEKRIAKIVRALASASNDVPLAHLLLIGDPSDYPSLRDVVTAVRMDGRVTIAGAVADADLGRHFAAADVCLCLRWPTAEETSASWIRCLAAGRPTVISDLPHLVDVPALLARGWRCSHAARAPVAVAVDLVEEEASLHSAIARLGSDERLRRELGAAGYAYWRANHRLELMAEDYRSLIPRIASCPAPVVANLPSHFTDDYSSTARAIAARIGVDVDILRR